MLHLALRLINYAVWIVQLIIFAAVITRWLKLSDENPIARTLRSIADPLCEPARPLARKISNSIDWSPAIVIIVLELVRRVLL